MIEGTDRCTHFRREYPPVGSKVAFHNPIFGEMRNFTLHEVVAGNINVWAGPKSTPANVEVALKAAHIYANTYDISELRPVPESSSWMDHECKVFGAMPFMYTCSNRINMLLLECGFENAFVMSGDYLRNFPGPATNESIANHDIVFYMCNDILEADPNPYAAANTFAHELAHVIQGGFGHTFDTMTEGGATWLEGALLRLPPRPMVYAWGFRDWNEINAAHFYANTKELNARKFYQIHAMFLTYLMQDELLGTAFTSALQTYATFNNDDQPWGRSAYDYFLGRMGKSEPTSFHPVQLDTNSVDYPFADALVNYHVAIAAACIKDGARRPTQAEYLLPAHVRGRPYWDCSSYPTFWSAEFGASVVNASRKMHYGGAAVYRLAMPQGATISVAPDADPEVRTKVLAAGDEHGTSAEVHELRPGESVVLGGYAREVFVVQVNVDPKGEVISEAEVDPLWRHTTVDGERAWMMAGAQEGEEYLPDVVQGLLTPVLRVPAYGTASVDFQAWWDLEAESVDGSKVRSGCYAKGYDGLQVRIHSYEDGVDASDLDAAKIQVVRPEGGYGSGPGGEAAIHAFSDGGIYGADEVCSNFEGWTGKSSGASTVAKNVSLDAFAGKQIRIEFLFVSDGGTGGKGFLLRNIHVSGANPLHELDDSMWVRAYIKAPPPGGTRGPITGVPVVTGFPKGYAPDRSLMKNAITREAPWSASWEQSPSDQLATLRREWLGWSYSAPSEDTTTAQLHPEQEACMLLKAPFTGAVQSATLFTLVDKIGITAVSLTLRSPKAPFSVLPGFATMLSESLEVEDKGTHRFDVGSASAAPLLQGTPFLICIGIGSTRELVSDVGLEPFLHLPVTEVPSAGLEGQAGATFLLCTLNSSTSGLDPWVGHSLTLRAEFVEASHFGGFSFEQAYATEARSNMQVGHRTAGSPFGWGATVSVAGLLLLGVFGSIMVRRVPRQGQNLQDAQPLQQDDPEEPSRM
mmetsp:Transcript_81275/g.263563  ORF Transcript_81275/g.263563 Transcript_81275/m.263563 type:complete len:975 (-) Transcript_81275:413-3337(-)